MSFNPVLAQTPSPDGRGKMTLMPLCGYNERLLLIRDKCSLKMQIAGKSYSGSGFGFLTSRRMVFLKDGEVSKHKNWSSCEFPLHCIHNNGANNDQPDFQQPIFGANRLVFHVRPGTPGTENLFEADAKVELQFKNACYTFVKLFLVLMRSARGHGGDASSQVPEILGAAQAYTDPNDPSMIFFAQPTQERPCGPGGYMPMTQANPLPQAQLPPAYAAPTYYPVGSPLYPNTMQYGTVPPMQYGAAPPMQYGAAPPMQNAQAGHVPQQSNQGNNPTHPQTYAAQPSNNNPNYGNEPFVGEYYSPRGQTRGSPAQRGAPPCNGPTHTFSTRHN